MCGKHMRPAGTGDHAWICMTASCYNVVRDGEEEEEEAEEKDGEVEDEEVARAQRRVVVTDRIKAVRTELADCATGLLTLSQQEQEQKQPADQQQEQEQEQSTLSTLIQRHRTLLQRLQTQANEALATLQSELEALVDPGM